MSDRAGEGSSELRELYQEVIIDHSRSPRNRGSLPGATAEAQGWNPLCGDKVTIYVRVEGGRIEAASFMGSGCAISTASASTMTEAVRGRTLDEVERMFQTFHEVCTGKAPSDALAPYGKLAAFAGVREFPMRVKCATLSWHALENALHGTREVAKTE